MSDNKRKCNKFEHDKYYTPQHVVDYVVKKTIEVVGSDFDCVVEPSAGNGAFIQAIEDSFKGSKKVYMDLYPDADGIVQQDYLEYEHKHEGKTLVIGNPPFGNRNRLSVKFYNKSVSIADIIAFILPIGQLHNTQQLYKFDLVYSEDIGVVMYGLNGEVKCVRCCFNIYQKPAEGLNKLKTHKYENFKVTERQRQRETCGRKFTGVGICAYGAALGTRVKYQGEYVREVYLTGDSDIVSFVLGYNWLNHRPHTASPCLPHWVIYEEVKKHFNLIEGDFDENKYSK